MQLVARQDQWFAERLGDIGYDQDVTAYVVGVLSRVRYETDMSKESVVLAFHDARFTGNFATFQRIGDWALWLGSFHPSTMKNNCNVIETFGRLSYHACHRIMQGQWVIYEELADELPNIVERVNLKLKPLSLDHK